MMRDRLAIPFIGPKGNVYDIRFRCIQQHDCKEASCPKYLGIDGVETRLYATRSLVAPTDFIFVTEGELDAASVIASGWPAVGLPGANAWKGHYPRMFAGFSRVILLADDDEAGRKLASTFRRAMLSSGTVMVCGYRDAHDVNEILVRYGKEGLMDFLKKGMSDDEG